MDYLAKLEEYKTNIGKFFRRNKGRVFGGLLISTFIVHNVVDTIYTGKHMISQNGSFAKAIHEYDGRIWNEYEPKETAIVNAGKAYLSMQEFFDNIQETDIKENESLEKSIEIAMNSREEK